MEQGDRKWQQDELELVLEQDIRVCGRKMKCVGAGISGGGPPWAHEVGARPGDRARPPPSWPGGCPLLCSQCQIFSNIPEKKSYLNFRAFGELLFSGYFYIARIIQKTDE